jgi:CheY-like chemotaxis protein
VKGTTHEIGVEGLVRTGAGDRLRVFVVEGEPIAREILCDLLKMAGYDTLSAGTGEQALLILVQERGRIDCLFTAIELPGLVDGWMLADEFRTAGATRPIVFATRSKPKARRSKDVAFVARPVLPPQAVEAFNKVTGRTAAVAKSRRLARVAAEAAEPVPEVASQAMPLRATG